MGRYENCGSNIPLSEAKGAGDFAVMLSEALQRNAKHEARLSNISGRCWLTPLKNDQRFFAALRMTFKRTTISWYNPNHELGCD